ncbi:MAG: LOG family protein [Chloroflexota bacterium]
MRVTVFGSARTGEGTPEYAVARELGRLLAGRGDVVVSGGYGGVMEAASRGAREAGGQVVGVTVAPWIGRLEPNVYLSEEISAENLLSRLEALVESDALIALDGGAGTLLEVALAWNLRQMSLMPVKPIILLGKRWSALLESFRATLIIDEQDLDLLTLADTPAGAVAALETSSSQSGQFRG